MNFARVLKEVLWCLVTEGSISYRRIKLSYGLDDDAVEELRCELIGIKRLAADIDGERLVWAPEARAARAEADTTLRQKLPALRLAERPPTPVADRDLPSVQYYFRVKGDYRTIAAIERDAKGYVAVAGKVIKTPQDLAGKTIATRVGSTGSWFISEYLTKNHVDPKTVTIKNLDTQVLPAALCGGEIAAFFIWQPVGSRTLEICPDKAHYLTDATGYIQGYLVAGARPEWLATPQGKDIAIRWLRATIKGRDVAEKNFKAVAAYAADKLSLSESATKEQWDTNMRPIAIDKVYYSDFCSLSRWGQSEKATDGKVDFTTLTWPDGLKAIDPKLVDPPPPPC